jgi:uncharacterized protein YoxC
VSDLSLAAIKGDVEDIQTRVREQAADVNEKEKEVQSVSIEIFNLGSFLGRLD